MRVATVDAVSHTIDATLSLEARGTAIKGVFVTLRCGDDLLLGRVIDVDLSNVVHSDETFAPYIMQHGQVPHWSGEVDIERAKIEPVRAINSDGASIALRRNPPSGTPIELATADDLEKFQTEHERILVVGTIPNSDNLPASIINRDFGPCEQGGYGEARHTGIFGQTGSAKTVLATTLLAGRLAANPDMGLLLPDTAGDLSNPASHSRGNFRWNYAEVLQAAGIGCERINIADVRLTSTTTLRAKLTPLFQTHFTMREEQAGELARKVVSQLTDKGRVEVADIASDKVLDAAAALIGSCYAKASRDQKEQQVTTLQTNPSLRRHFENDLSRITALFDGREVIGHLVHTVLMKGRKIIIDASSSMAQADQEFLLREIMDQLSWQAERAFKDRGNNSCNALVVLDEGQRWIPEGGGGDDENVSRVIRRALRETRKYGLGWMIIAQSPSGVSKEVLRQAHTIYFGRGLGVGADQKHLSETLGKPGLEAYEQLAIQGGYFWVGIGQDNNVGTEATYFAFRPFDGDATTAFINANPRIFKRGA